MPEIDDDGRVPIPDDVVKRLGVEPGHTHVRVTADSGRIVLEPDPDEEGDPPWNPDIFSRKHRERIYRGARRES